MSVVFVERSMIMIILSVGIFFLVVAFFVTVIGLVIGYISIKNESKAFENMIMNPNNNTVAQYIKVLKHSNKVIEKYNVFETRIRLSQGFIEISDYTNVSTELKEQLKNALMIKGIPV